MERVASTLFRSNIHRCEKSEASRSAPLRRRRANEDLNKVWAFSLFSIYSYLIVYQSDIQPFLEQTPILPWQLELLKLLLISIKYQQQHQIRRWLNANQNSYLLHLPGVSFYLVPRYSFIFRKLYCIYVLLACQLLTF